MKIAFLVGPWSTTNHAPLDPHKLHEQPLSDSESALFSLAHGLAGRGHEVYVYCATIKEAIRYPALGGASVLSIAQAIPQNLDAYVALNEPDLLREVPATRQRVCWQQLGDFPGHSRNDFDHHVDHYIAVTPNHLTHISTSPGLFRTPPEKWRFLPNAVNLEHFSETAIIRQPYSMAWLSSPDRGLHHLLGLFPAIKRVVPEATLHIYCHLDDWLHNPEKHGNPISASRARHIKECLAILGRNGENGVQVTGTMPSIELGRQLLATKVFPYTCETTAYTETFSTSTMNACAAGCLPILTPQDALRNLYRDVAQVISILPASHAQQWVTAIERAMKDEKWWKERSEKARQFARLFARPIVAALWERFLHGQETPTDVLAYVSFAREAQTTLPPLTASHQRLVPVPGLSGIAVNSSISIDTEGRATTVQNRPAEPLTTAIQASSLPARSSTRPSEPPRLPELPKPPITQSSMPPSPARSKPMRKLRIAVMMGKVGASVHGKLNVRDIFDNRENFVTGTVSGFFNIAWGLAERGHQVDAFCDAKERVINSPWGGAHFYPADNVVIDSTYDAYISINEPDLLCNIAQDKLKLCVTWLNDFSFSAKGFEVFDRSVDFYVSPSWTLADRLSRNHGIATNKMSVIPLCINPEFHDQAQKRRPGSIAYCSSPDRGLHILLSLFPRIRERVPHASLRIYYRLIAWLKDQKYPEIERRAEIIRNMLGKLGSNGENGVHLVDIVPPRVMAKELGRTEVLAYTCDPVVFTEGFSVAVMDACAAGCVPIISGVDALPEIYWNGPHVIFGRPEEKAEQWIDTITLALTDQDFAAEVRLSAKMLAREHTRQKIARRWERLIMDNID